MAKIELKNKEIELEKQKEIQREKEIIRNVEVRKNVVVKVEKSVTNTNVDANKNEKFFKNMGEDQEEVVNTMEGKTNTTMNTMNNTVDSMNGMIDRISDLTKKNVKPESFFDQEKKVESKKPESLNSSFSGDEFDHVANQINIEKSEKIPELSKNTSNTHNNSNVLSTSQITKTKDDFIENLFSNKPTNDYNSTTGTTGYKYDFYKEDKIVKSSEIPFDDFPLQRNNNTTSRYNLEDEDDDDTLKPTKDTMDDSLKKTKDMYTYINENEELKKQQNDLDKFCNFAVESLKHFVPKLMSDMDKENYSQEELNKLMQNPGTF